MTGTWTLFGFIAATFILLTAFVDLIALLTKRRLPLKKGIVKKWKKQGISAKEEVSTTKYKKRELSFSEMIITVFLGLALFFIGLVFFRSFLFSLLFSLLAFFYPRIKRRSAIEKRKKIFLTQFRDAMNSISNSLRAGSSLQVSLKRCESDLRKELITQKDKPVLEEFVKINHDIEFGMSVDQALRQFKEHMQLEDVDQFVDAILITRAKGGNLTQVTRNTAERISDKITIQQEIQLGTSQKRMEAKILTIFPVVMVLILMLTNPTYMQPMYDSFLGTFFLFLAAVLLVANYFIGKKVTNIDL
ncbi:type II secretion system F family protein [Alteribacter populi]|uniref:type II secretion system F family protein n=1 Tax=Alteribacter populi TaxID=2011011 RepID=UPI000BBB10D3|nr:type II secretion system F family protein [Alteribacter populi]